MIFIISTFSLHLFEKKKGEVLKTERCASLNFTWILIPRFKDLQFQNVQNDRSTVSPCENEQLI